jgi:hypothetical protein
MRWNIHRQRAENRRGILPRENVAALGRVTGQNGRAMPSLDRCHVEHRRLALWRHA